jgi:serine protease Do
MGKPFTLLAATLWLLAGATVPASTALRALGDAFAGVYEKVAPAVVVLEVSKPGGDRDNFSWESLFGGPGMPPSPRAEESEGSGFFIRPDGYILTNAHVIEGADPDKGIVARRHDGTRLPLRVVGVDDKTDLAVLKADAADLPSVSWGDSDRARVGEFVCVIGAPWELDYTLTVGVISAKGRSNLTSTVYEDYLQTDAAINPGNSGGPLLDLDGKVIGVNTLINGLSRGLGFAIPSNLARAISAQLIEDGRVVRPWLGIRIETLAEQPALQKMLGLDNGVVVREIFDNTPASRSELQPADVVVDVDGQPVASARDLQRSILGKEIGQTVKLKVWRRQDSAYRTVSVQAEELPPAPADELSSARPAPFRPPAADAGEAADIWSRLGVEVQDLPDDVAAEMSLPAGGVIVTNVQPGSPAAMAGLERRDVITAAGDENVRSKEELAAALGGVAEGEGAVLLVERKGKKTYAILKQ